MKQKGGEMGFYPTNTEVLKFDVNKDLEEIKFNHYIMRKENYQRLKNTLPKGQFYLAINSVKLDLNVSRSKAQRLIDKFVELGIIENIYKPKQGDNTKPSIYRYNSCLNSDTENDNGNDTESGTEKVSNCKGLKSNSDTENDNGDDTESDTSKKEYIKKNYKKENNIYSAFDSYTENEELKTALKDFSEMRKTIKKPFTTTRAITMLLNKLNNLASTDEEKKLILEQSIFNNWQGIFPLKNENLYKPSQGTTTKQQLFNFEDY